MPQTTLLHVYLLSRSTSILLTIFLPTKGFFLSLSSNQSSVWPLQLFAKKSSSNGALLQSLPPSLGAAGAVQMFKEGQRLGFVISLAYASNQLLELHCNSTGLNPRFCLTFVLHVSFDFSIFSEAPISDEEQSFIFQ